MAKKFDIANYLDNEEEREIFLEAARELDQEKNTLGLHSKRALGAIARSRGLTKIEIAKRTGLTRQAVANFFKEDKNMNFFKILEAIGAEINISSH